MNDSTAMPTLAIKAAGPLKLGSKTAPPPSMIIKVFFLSVSLVFSVWLINQAVYCSDYLYTYLGVLIEDMEQPDDLYFIKNLVPAFKPYLAPLKKNQAVQSNSRPDLRRKPTILIKR